jgi:hypothetical protein
MSLISMETTEPNGQGRKGPSDQPAGAAAPLADIAYLAMAPLMLWFGGGIAFSRLWSIPGFLSEAMSLPTPWDAWRLLLSPFWLGIYNLVTYVVSTVDFLGSGLRGPAALVAAWLMVAAAYRHVTLHTTGCDAGGSATPVQQTPPRARAHLALLLASMVPVGIATMSTVYMLADLALAG